ncbi:MAG TPA: aminoglycoside phosphotransferase family protein, partial [Actinopolymorphaceae bacterium]
SHEFEPSDLPGYVHEVATTLVRIHNIAPTGLASTNPHRFDVSRAHRWISDPALARAVVEAASDNSPGQLQPVLVHGDYQPLNMLWQGQRLSGVVDWAYAGSGPREIDVGLCRFSLAVVFSEQTAETFLSLYEAEAGVQVDPRADIRALLSFEPSWLSLISRQMARPGPTDRRGMVDRVEATLRRAIARLP